MNNTYYEHLLQERKSAMEALSKAKIVNKEKVSIYIKDAHNTVFQVDKKDLHKKLKRLKSLGYLIKSVL